MDEITIACLTVFLGEIFLFSLMIIGTLLIYYHFAQPNEPSVDIDSIEMNEGNSLKSYLS